MQLSCCGNNGPQDWLNDFHDSCCPINPNTQCTSANAFSQGCTVAVNNFVENGALMIGIVLLCLAAVEFIGFVFACCLANSIRNQDRRQYA